jgi:hypothetical protein
MTSSRVNRLLARSPWRYPRPAETARRAVYSLLSLPLTTVAFVAAVVSLFVSCYLMLFGVGVFAFIGMFASAAWHGRGERARMRRLLGADLPDPERRVPSRSGMVRLFATRVRDPQAWRDLAYCLLAMPLAALSCTITVLLLALLARAVTYPVIGLFDSSFYAHSWGGPSYLGTVAVHSGQGVLVLLLGPFAVRWATGAQSGLARRLLSAGAGGA